MLRRLSVSLYLAAMAGSVIAHSELPSGHWCEGGRPVEVASFRFEPEALAPRGGSGTCTGAGDGESRVSNKIQVAAKNCGQFDDDYQRGFDASGGYCATFQRTRRRGEIADAGSVVVLVTEPASFLSSTHHRDYSVSQGLSGVCVRCESVVVAIPSPLQRDSLD